MAAAILNRLLLLQLISVWSSPAAVGIEWDGSPHLNRSSFPPDFLFGAGSSSYQFEGAAFKDGKGPSIWDTFTHKFPDKVADRNNGDMAVDFYHLYKDDVRRMKFLELNSFRMSISWPRILPRGKLSEGVNKKGIAFYNNVFNELITNGITPFVTLFHWDLPQALEDEYKGFLSPLIIDDYRDFAELCFKEFGDRVKHWVTFNEPHIFVIRGYDGGMGREILAPGRCTSRKNCAQGNSATEPYIAGHHMLICHAIAVKSYMENYQATQKGEIGISLLSHWMVPYSKHMLDFKAAQRALDFMYGWFLHPLVYGEYPKTMQSIVGNRLPQFTRTQITMLKGSFDFIGLNYYTGNYISHLSARNAEISCSTDVMANYTLSKNGIPIGDPTDIENMFVYPQGLHHLLVYTKEKYNNPIIYITETGIPNINNASTQQLINDMGRIKFFKSYLLSVHQAIQDGVNVKGFFAWAFLDCFEWISGFTHKFGLYYIDRKNRFQRTPKKSALWFKQFLSKH